MRENWVFMEQKKYVQKLLNISSTNIDKIRNIDLKVDYSPFEGFPKRHPFSDNVLILVENPFEENQSFLEFYLDTITSVEELGNITSEKNQSAYKIRIWVKKGTVAIKSETFIIE